MRRCYGEGRSKAVLAGRVGGAATTAERTYLATLLTGVSSRLIAAVTARSVEPLAQIAAMGLGLAVTATGYALGTLRRLMFDRSAVPT